MQGQGVSLAKKGDRMIPFDVSYYKMRLLLWSLRPFAVIGDLMSRRDAKVSARASAHPCKSKEAA